MAFTPGVTKSIIYTVASGGTQQIDNGITLAVMNASGLLGTLTVVFPVKPLDGQPLSIICPKGVTLLSVTVPTGQSISGTTPTVGVANQAMRYKFSAANSTWYPN